MDEIRCALEYRQDETNAGPGRLVGTILEYETRALDRPEIFSQDALTWPDAGITLSNYLKTGGSTGGDTRLGRRPVGAGPGSWMPFCRNAPGSHGI